MTALFTYQHIQGSKSLYVWQSRSFAGRYLYVPAGCQPSSGDLHALHGHDLYCRAPPSKRGKGCTKTEMSAFGRRIIENCGIFATQTMPPLLSIQNLSIDFQTDSGLVPGVRGIDLQVDRGEIVALVGESGSGKSITSLAILQLLATPPAIYSSRVKFYLLPMR